MSHLKRKIEGEISELYNVEIVIRVIQDKSGFIVSNNSVVEEHFKSGDTIYFEEHGSKEKTGSNMNLSSNLGEILSTIRFMTGSGLEKLDSTPLFNLEIDLTKSNVLEIVANIMHFGFWIDNTAIVQKLYRIFNKMFGNETIEKFMNESS